MSEGIEIGLDTLVITGEPSKLYEALAKAQGEFIPVPRSDTGAITEKRSFKYAGYATLMRCIRPALTANGISIIQPLHSRGGLAVTTTIVAGHGASIQASLSFTPDPNPQEFGRRHTYYRRYQLQAMMGVEGDDDADNLPKPETHEQYAEPAPKAPRAPKKEPAQAAPKEPSAPPLLVSVEKTAAAAPEQKSAPFAPSSEPSTAVDLVTINQLLAKGMEQLKWTMGDVREFFVKHVDAEGFSKPSNMTIEQKRALHSKMVELKGVAPF